MMCHRFAPAIALVLALATVAAAEVSQVAQADTSAQIEQARKQMASGDMAGAVKALERIAKASPRSFEAHLLLGQALDLEGQYRAARKHLEEAVRLASDSEERNSALTALGISYAFEKKADEAARYYQRAFDAQVQANDRGTAAAFANALGRIYLESGNLEKAEQWYTTGHETVRQVPGLTPAQTALWEMRRHNALGRIEARRGNQAAALEHADKVKELLDKGGNENQRPFYPYLLGYIAFYSRDYRGALDHLLKGDQDDPFVLGLIAQSYEKLGDKEKAAEYYRKVMDRPVHTINSAFSRPLARKFLR